MFQTHKKGHTLPETNMAPEKIDGWIVCISCSDMVYFQGRTVSFREGNRDRYFMVYEIIPT